MLISVLAEFLYSGGSDAAESLVRSVNFEKERLLWKLFLIISAAWYLMTG